VTAIATNGIATLSQCDFRQESEVDGATITTILAARIATLSQCAQRGSKAEVMEYS
jgi:hypothetical protein